MSRKKSLALLMLFLLLVTAGQMWAQYPVHTRLLFEDDLQSAGVKSFGEIVNGNMDNKWTPGKFVSGGWEVSSKFSQLRIKLNDYLPSEGTMEIKVSNFNPPKQLEEFSVSPISIWSRPECDMALLEKTPASFFYAKCEQKYLLDNTARFMLRIHPTYVLNPADTNESDYLVWDASKTYTFKLVWNGRGVWLVVNGAAVAYQAGTAGDYFRESFAYICIGNSTWDGMVGPIYSGFKIYGPATNTPFVDVTKSTKISGDKIIGAQSVAIGDVNGDGLADAYASFFWGTDSPKPNLLWIQQADGTFTDEAAARGIGDSGLWGAAAFLDVDADGDQDIVQGSRSSAPRLYINANGSFSEQSSLRGITGTGRDVKAILILDLENDGDEDFIAIDGTAAHEVYVNRGSGVFDKKDGGIGAFTGSVQGAITGDFNGDGYTDVFITRRDSPCGLFINKGNGTFSDEAASRGINYSGKSNCPSAADYDNDGDLDIFIGIRGTTADKSPLCMVFDNNGSGSFTNRSDQANIHIDTYGLYPGDFNNDGYVDLYGLRFDREMDEPPTSRIFYNKKDKSFAEATGTGAEMLYIDGRAGVLLDYNADGLLDILGVGKGKIEPNSKMPYGRTALLKNTIQNTNHYLQMAVLDRFGKVNGLGSRIWIYPAGQYGQSTALLGYRQVLPNQGYQSSTNLVQHFGLGTNSSVDVKVQTTNGKVFSYTNIPVDRRFTLSPFGLKPSAIVKIKGDGQTGAANAVLTDSLVVKVTDVDNKELAGYPVTFEILQGGGTLNGSSAIQQVSTDASGKARVAWKVGTTVGVNNNVVKVTANKEDGTALTGSPLQFTASAIAGPGANMIKVSGDNQQNYINQTLSAPLVVKVTDAFNNPVAGQKVTFEIIVGNGSINDSGVGKLDVSTDGQGQAQVNWKLGNVIGLQRMNAYASFNSSAPNAFSATGVEPQRQLLLQSGNYQSATVAQPLTAPLVVKLQDFRGNVITNERIRFTVIAGGGKVAGQTTAEAMTGSDGLAAITASLGTASGDTNNVFHAIYESAQGSPVVFKATARAAAPSQMIEVSLNNQTGKVNRTLARAFTVRVLDSYSNPINGHQVTFTVSAGGGTLSGGTSLKVSTDAGGYASATLKLGTTIGINTVLVTSAGLQGSPVTFNAESQAGNPAKFFEVSGNKQRGTFGQVLPYPFVVGLSDSFANPIVNHPVQFTVTKGSGSLAGQGLVSVLTNSSGRASATLTLGATGYINEVTASTQYGGVSVGSSLVFTATTAAGNPDSLAYVSGNFQIGRVSSMLPQPLKVLVLDANGIPVANYPVTFLAVLTGTSFNGKQTLEVKTDGEGIASATPTIGGSYGDNNNVFQARAYYNNILLRNSPLEFFASGRRSTARKIVYVSGNTQEGIVGQYLPDSLRVRVVDEQNNPVANHPVSFEVIQGNATINGMATTYAALSNSAGLAVVSVKMASQPLQIRIRVSTDDGKNALTGSPMYFEATSVIGPPSTLKSTRTVVTPIVADGIQTSTVTVLLKDAEGNTVPNKVVQIYSKGLDVHIKQPDTASDPNGMAQGWLSSTRIGTVKVWTMVDGKMVPADTAAVTFIAGLPTEAVPFGSGQMVLRGTVLPMPLGVNLYDANGNPVANVDVTFKVLTGGGTILQQQPVKTDAQGKASVQWQLGPTVDTQTMQAVVSGLVGNPIVFTAIAMPPNPGTIELVSGDRQIGQVNKTLADSFKVIVRDSTGKVAEGLQVYFHFTGQGQAMSPNPVRTDRRGIAAILYRPGGSLVGEYKATATVPGLTQSVEFKFMVQSLLTIYLTAQEIKPSSRPLEVLNLAVQAQDAYNRPIKGQLLKFEVKEGGGELQGTLPAPTDSNGFARVQWKLGLAASQKVQVSPINVNATSLSFSTTAVNNKPKLTVPATKNVLPGQLVAAEIIASDMDGDALSIKARMLPTGAIFDSTRTHLFQWTPNTLQSGASYEVMFIATDAYSAADTAKWRINVEAVNKPPRITSITPADTILEKYYNQTLVFSVEAYDPDNNSLSYFWRVNGAFAGNQASLPMEPEPAYFPEDTWVQVEISDGIASVVVRWHVHLSVQQAVRLSNFEVQPSGRKAELRWQTAAEVDNLGFKILRSANSQGPYEVITETMIPSTSDGRYFYLDEGVQPGLTYFYKLRDIDRNGLSNEHGPVSITIALPEALALAQNYPNPFNPTTTISFELPKAQSVELRIYNLSGQVVRTLANGTHSAGVHQVVWDGRDDQGRPVTSGLYYYMLQAADKVITRKLLFAK